MAFDDAGQVPTDYYTPLLSRTDEPVAVAEGAWSSGDIVPFHGSTDDQIGYMCAVETQLGGRIMF